MIGKTLGHYEIFELLGSGGMGEVYLARDPRLGRKVAIKVLPPEFAADPERLARFEQEARAAAALNHPHIAVVHDVGAEVADDGTEIHFIVQEYLDGASLRELLTKGALPLKKALGLAGEVAEALVAAHGAGIVHRDLKPDNIFVTGEGHAKVLDFGLAKLTESAGSEGSPMSMSPTMLGTVAGQVMGTAGYMAPEQVAGDADIDHRADLFAFGCVLYEMVANCRAFSGETSIDVLHAISRTDPGSLALINSELPAELERISKKCLAKERSDRYQSAADLTVDLRSLAGAIEAGTAAPLHAAEAALGFGGGRRGFSPVLLGFIALASLALGAAATSLWLQSPPPAVKWFDIALPRTYEFPLGVGSLVAISPNGEHLVYVAESEGTRRLYHRPMDSLRAEPVPGTELAEHPFFSPDSEWIGFFRAGTFNKIRIDGGTPIPIVTPQAGSGYGVWRADDTIVWSEGPGGLWSVPSTGGEPERLVEVDREIAPDGYERLDLLPGGDAVVAETLRGGTRNLGIAFVSLRTGEQILITEQGSDPAYVASGHVVFARGDELLAVPVDTDALRTTGDVARILRDVRVETGGAAHFAATEDGTFVYVPGTAAESTLVWITRDGTETEIAGDRFLRSPRLSPDRSRVAVQTSPPGALDEVWIFDLETGIGRRLTVEGDNRLLAWEPGTESVLFYDDDSGGIYRALADFSGTQREFIAELRSTRSASVAPDRSLIAVATAYGIWLLDLTAGAELQTLIDSRFDATAPAISPDGSWLAYVSSESGRDEVLVTSFPVRGATQQVSTQGGTEPLWSPDGQELFYRTSDELIAARVELTPVFRVVERTPLFPAFDDDPWVTQYDYDPEGQRFIMARRPPSESISLSVILNWFDELKRLAPVER